MSGFEIPTLRTARLVLRAFGPADAAAVQRHLADADVARNTLTVPHPYPEGAAAEFITAQDAGWRAGRRATWAILRAADEALVGAIGLQLVPAHRRAELGYWIAKPAWGQGYATEAARAVLDCAFGLLALHRVEAHHFVENPASGRVMAKAGMHPEGLRRGAVWRDGVPRDLQAYAILRDDPRS